jgi:hypothetical protein
MVDKKDQTDGPTSFTVDSDPFDTGEMPSVTKLLNRKSLGVGKNSTQPPQEPTPSPPVEAQPEPTPAVAITEPVAVALETPQLAEPSAVELNVSQDQQEVKQEEQEVEREAATEMISRSSLSSSPSVAEITLEPPLESLSSSSDSPLTAPPTEVPVFAIQVEPEALSAQPSQPPQPPQMQPPRPPQKPSSLPSTGAPRIQAAPRRSAKAVQKLIQWELTQLRAGKDPLGLGIAVMLQKGAVSALFLSITQPTQPSPVPLFISTAAVQPQNKLALWTGLSWDPRVAPEMWNQFVKTGVIELGPPSENTNQGSNRNILRTAFGINPNEWLILIRVGPEVRCRGVVALISNKSILAELNSAKTYFSADLIS